MTSFFFSEGNHNTTNGSALDKEWIVNSSKILDKLMIDYDPSMAPFVPGMSSHRLRPDVDWLE